MKYFLIRYRSNYIHYKVIYIYMAIICSYITQLGILRGQKSKTLILNISKWRKRPKSNIEQKVLKNLSFTICNHNFFVLRSLKGVTGSVPKKNLLQISRERYRISKDLLNKMCFYWQEHSYDIKKKGLALQIRGWEGS